MNNGSTIVWRLIGLALIGWGEFASNCHPVFCANFAVQEENASRVESDGPEHWDKESELANSYFQAFLANAKAIRSGDCLVRICRNSDSVNSGEEINLDGVLIQEVEWKRIRFDSDSRRFVVASSVTRERLDLGRIDPATGKQTRKSKDHVLLASTLDGRDYCNFGNLDFQRIPVGDEAGLRTLYVDNVRPDLRAGGWFGSLHRDVDSLEKDLLFQSSSKWKSTISESPKVLSIRTYFGRSSDAQAYIDTDLDSKSLMPIKSRAFTKLQESDKWPGSGGKWFQFTGFVENVEWIEKSGVWLSTRLEHDQIGGIDPWLGSNSSEPLRDHTIVDQHWFSVNEKFEDAAFDGSLIESERNVYRLLDPQLNNATTILERMKAEQPTIKPNPENDAPKRE